MNAAEAKTTIFGVLEQIAPEVDAAQVDHGVELDEQLDLDSMDFLNWMIGISRETGIDIPQRDAKLFITIDGAAAYLVEHAA